MLGDLFALDYSQGTNLFIYPHLWLVEALSFGLHIPLTHYTYYGLFENSNKPAALPLLLL